MTKYLVVLGILGCFYSKEAPQREQGASVQVETKICLPLTTTIKRQVLVTSNRSRF